MALHEDPECHEEESCMDSEAQDIHPCPGDTGAPPKKRPGHFDRDYLIWKIAETNPFKDRDVPEVEMPVRPVLNKKHSVAQRIKACQKYIESFEYNFLPYTLFNTNKYRPLARIMDTCKGMVRECLPIRCLEATFLGIYLTNELMEIDRIPVSFKSEFNGEIYRHIVLLIRHGDKWGALGLSRKSDLMYKSLTFGSLAEVLWDYKSSYEKYDHNVVAFKIGLPVGHDLTSTTIPCWKFFAINVATTSYDELVKITGNYAGMASKLAQEWETYSGITNRSKKKIRDLKGCDLDPTPIKPSLPNTTQSNSSNGADDRSPSPSSTQPISLPRVQPLDPSSPSDKPQLSDTSSSPQTSRTPQPSSPSSKPLLEGSLSPLRQSASAPASPKPDNLDFHTPKSMCLTPPTPVQEPEPEGNPPPEGPHSPAKPQNRDSKDHEVLSGEDVYAPDFDTEGESSAEDLFVEEDLVEGEGPSLRPALRTADSVGCTAAEIIDESPTKETELNQPTSPIQPKADSKGIAVRHLSNSLLDCSIDSMGKAAHPTDDDFSDDGEDNNMVIGCILMNRSPLRKRYPTRHAMTASLTLSKSLSLSKDISLAKENRGSTPKKTPSTLGGKSGSDAPNSDNKQAKPKSVRKKSKK